jgi:ABC-type lipoprotein release transport system permease subunit
MTGTLIFVAIGGAVSFAVSRWIASLLFGTAPTDPQIFAAMMSLLAAVALLAGQIPARQASRIDPMAVLRGL